MKVLYSSKTVFPSRSASSIQIINACLGFYNYGYDVKLFGLRPGEEDGAKEQIELTYDICIPFSFISFRRRKLKLVNFIVLIYNYLAALGSRHERYDVVYTRSLHLSIISLLKVRRVFLEVHDVPAKTDVYLFKIFSFALRKKWIILSSPSKSLLRYYRRFIVLESEYIWMPHGSSHASIYHNSTSENVAKVSSTAELGKDHNKNGRLCCAYVGSVGFGKGLDFVIELAAALPNIDFQLAVLCSSDTLKRDIEKLITENVYLNFNFGRHDILNLYKYVDVLLLPVAKFTGKGGSVSHVSRQLAPLRSYEYLAAEKPIIASNIWPNREIYGQLEHVFLRPLVIREWVSIVNSLERNVKSSANFRQAAINANMTYTWEKRAERIKGVFDI